MHVGVKTIIRGCGRHRRNDSATNISDRFTGTRVSLTDTRAKGGAIRWSSLISSNGRIPKPGTNLSG